MARQKNPTALFDVIHSAKKPPKPSPSAAIPTPKWWGKNKALPKSPAVESTENVGKQKSWLTAAKRNGIATPPVAIPVTPVLQSAPETVPPVLPTPMVSEPGLEYWPSPTQQAPVTESVEIPSAPEAAVVSEYKPRFIDRFKNRAPSTAQPTIVEPEVEPIQEPVFVESIAQPIPEPVVSEMKPERPPSRSREERESFMRVDPAAGDIRFRMSYAGLIAIGFVFVLLLAIAFLVGTRASQQADDASLPSGVAAPAPHTAGMMAAVGPAATGSPAVPQSDPQNADPQNGSSPAGSSASAGPVQPDVLSVPPHGSRPVAVANSSTPAAAPLPIRKTREIGMLYVVVQSYPEQELAQKACDFMNNAGIACTLVQGPANWAPSDWFSVVGLQPFNKHDAGLADYEKSIRNIGVKFTPRIIDEFQPQAYTWRADSDLSQP